MTNWLQRTEFSPDLSNVKWREKIFKQELYNNLQNLTGLVLRKLKGGGRMESRADFNAEESGAAKLDLGKLVDLINEILEQQDKNSRQLTQVLRENINFQNQVRRGMYDELEELKDRQRGPDSKINRRRLRRIPDFVGRRNNFKKRSPDFATSF